ncbi:MAG: hypothetical protein MUF81_13725 [Verrucomicrobia bacterium]|jgi:hypothetical protein|nr:hypothetical protein [Verrucomicrobiota bacterium]
MKISLALGNREALSPQTARGCVATNLALPGFGSLMAGRAIGYAQAVFTVVAFALTVVFGVKFILWGLMNWSKIHDPQADPVETMVAFWHGARWALLGMALFAVSWLWALATNASILRAAPKNEEAGKPPKLT